MIRPLFLQILHNVVMTYIGSDIVKDILCACMHIDVKLEGKKIKIKYSLGTLHSVVSRPALTRPSSTTDRHFEVDKVVGGRDVYFKFLMQILSLKFTTSSD